MLLRILAAVAVIFFGTSSTFAANGCVTWESGTNAIARLAEAKDVKVAGVLLTTDETKAFWSVFLATDSPPLVPGERTGFIIVEALPGVAMAFGYNDAGCLFQDGKFPFGKVIDALSEAGVVSEFMPLVPGLGT